MIYGNCNAACVEPHLNSVLCLQGTIITPATFLLFYFCFEDRNSKQITYSHDILLHAFTLYAKLGRLRKGQPLICRLPALVLPHIRYCNMAAQRLRSKKPVVHETRWKIKYTPYTIEGKNGTSLYSIFLLFYFIAFPLSRRRLPTQASWEWSKDTPDYNAVQQWCINKTATKT